MPLIKLFDILEIDDVVFWVVVVVIVLAVIIGFIAKGYFAEMKKK